MTSVDAIALQLEAGAGLILQRVPPALDASTVAAAVNGVVVDGFRVPAPGVRVLDARQCRSFEDLDAVRADLADEVTRSSLVVLLDHTSASALAEGAPHTVSWAGGIALPPDHPARGVLTDEEFAQGARALNIALSERPGFADKHAGAEVAIDLLTRRLFVRSGTSTALDIAREHIDDGIVYVERLPR